MPKRHRERPRNAIGPIWVCTIGFLGLMFLLSPSAGAINANPLPFLEKQPDGTIITLQVRGDERFHWMEDTKGYTVIRDAGWYVYAEKDAQGYLVPTVLAVGYDDPEGADLSRHILPAPAVMNAIKQFSPPTSVAKGGQPERTPTAGTVNNLVIMIRFSDHTGRTLPSNGNMDTLFNAVDGHVTYAPTGSVRDYYLENSYDQFTLNSTVVGWIDLPNTEAYYADGDSGTPLLWDALVYALDAADATVNFNNFDADNDDQIDAIAFIHSGYGAEWGGTDAYGAVEEDRIWSHKWNISPAWTSAEGIQVSAYHISPGVWGTSGSDIGRIGVIAHETGHFLGLPDLYDTDDDGSGIGSWGLMANSWGFDGSQLYPPHMCAWSKSDLGWLTPTVISTSGNYALNQLEGYAEAYRIDQGYPTSEYLLIENRQPVGFESDIPQGGLCIFHIDDTAGYNTQGWPGQPSWPSNGKHYRVTVLQADGDYDLELDNNRGDSGDVYHGVGVSSLTPTTTPNTDAYQGGSVFYTGNAITNISVSGANMSFEVDFGDDFRLEAVEGLSSTFDSTGLSGGPFTPASKTFTMSNVGASMLAWDIIVDAAWLSATVAKSGSLASGATQDVDIVLNAAADSLAVGSYSSTVEFRNTDSGFSHEVAVTLKVLESVFSFDLSTNPGWTTQGAWAYGVPTGNGGDPTSGHTGTKVYAYDLNGDYTNDMSETYLTTTALDFSNVADVHLSFWRWLGVEDAKWDNASIEASNDGTNWTVVWEHSGGDLSESAWSEHTYDISSVADGEATVYVRWVMGSTNLSVTYPGWNIDDVTFIGNVSDSLSEAWVDFADQTEPYLGTQAEPFNQVSDAVVAVVDDGSAVIKIKGNTATTQSSEVLSISKPMTIQAIGGAVRIGVAAP